MKKTVKIEIIIKDKYHCDINCNGCLISNCNIFFQPIKDDDNINSGDKLDRMLRCKKCINSEVK